MRPAETRRRRRDPGRRMQTLVYTFIAAAAVALGVAAYFALAFTPIEAALAALVLAALAVLAMERALRQRAESRLEKAIEELSRLLATDAQAGQVLGQRINALADQQTAQRVETLEADVSVLGTVVRQVAEAIAELEELRRTPPLPQSAPAPDFVPAAIPQAAPAIGPERVRLAIEDERLVFYLEPVFTLPQRRLAAYDLVPRLVLEDGEVATADEFMPQRGANDIVCSVGRAAVAEAIGISRRARGDAAPIGLNVPLEGALLADAESVDGIVSALDVRRATSQAVNFAIAAGSWQALTPGEAAAVAAFVDKGCGLAIVDAASLRLDWAGLAAAGVRAVRVDAGAFLDDPERFTDFHAADIVAYARRFGIELVATGVAAEAQVIALLDNGFAFAQGPHLGRAAAVRPEQPMGGRVTGSRRVQA